MTSPPALSAALRDFKLPDKLGFGLVAAPVMFSAEWSNGAWGRGELLPYGPIEILPGARALQYAELVFEGLKAYKVVAAGNGTSAAKPNLFRPRENWQRLARSAERLSMPAVPEALFFRGHRCRGGRVQWIDSPRVGPFALPAAVSIRNRGGLSAAQFDHLSLHGDRQPRGDLFLRTDAGGHRARRCTRRRRRCRHGPRRRQTTPHRCVPPMPPLRAGSPSPCGSTPANSATFKNCPG